MKYDIGNLGTGILVFDTKKRILLGKRLGNSYLPGLFGVPGGRVQIGESLIESARRELLEETGLLAGELKLVGLVNDNQRKHTFIHLVFACSRYSGKLQTLEPEKCEEWKWFELDGLPEEIMPGHRAGIDMYLNGNNLSELL